MKKLLTTTLLALSMTASSVHAIPIISGSKYPIIIQSFKGDSGCEAALKSDGTLQKIIKGVTGAIQGCEKIGNVTPLLNKGDKRTLPADSLVIA